MKSKKSKGSNNRGSGKLSRRQFMGAGATAVATAFTIVPSHVLAVSGKLPPSDRLNIAGIGIGGQGHHLIKGFADENVNIVALCDVDDDYAAKTFKLFPKAKKYRDYRTMLDKQKDIEAVFVATPDHTHAVISMAAIRMGKHVYCEKPLAYTIYESRRVTEAARQAKVATQLGNHGHSSEGIRLICEWILDVAYWDGPNMTVTNVPEVNKYIHREYRRGWTL